MLVAAKGTVTERTFQDIVQCLQDTPAALAAVNWTAEIRCLGFRLLSRLGCGVHALLRVPHAGHPYSLFQILLGERPPSLACLRDELAHAFFERFQAEPDSFSDDALGVREVLADLLEIDIAQVEAKHAAVRRLAMKKSMQTWTLDFQHLAAEWSCRQVAAARPATAEPEPAAHQRRADEGPRERTRGFHKDGKRKQNKGSGGGAYRAFIHDRYRGRFLTPQLLREASVLYKQLSDEEKAAYEDLGQRGKMSWSAGFKAFATPAPDAGGLCRRNVVGRPGRRA